MKFIDFTPKQIVPPNRLRALSAILTLVILSLAQCATHGKGKSEIEFENPNIRVERFPVTFNIKARGPVVCKSSPCSAEETGAGFKSLLRQGLWEEYVEKTDANDPQKKYSVLSKKGNYESGKRTGIWEEYIEKIDPKTNTTYTILDRKGQYQDGEKDGVWEYFYDDGAGRIGPLLKKTTFLKGIKEGPELKYNRSGEVIEESNYVNGLLDGKYINRTQNGLLEQEGQYSKDKKTGEWKEYYAEKKDMVLKLISNYKEDKKHGPEQRFYPDGKTKMMEGSFEEGLEKGPWKYYYDNGNLESEGAYKPIVVEPDPEVKDDSVTSAPNPITTTDVRSQVAKPKAKKVGPWKRYYKSGNLFFDGQRDGKPIGEWKFYHKNGNIAAKGEMMNDFMMKSGEIYDKAGLLEGKGKIRVSIIKLDEKTDELKLKYTPDAPFTFYKSGVKELEITTESMSGGNKAYMFNGETKIGEGPLDPATLKKNGCWTINGKKTYFLLDKPKTGAIATMNKCE
jgi:antitoxin component YwqK of YwqJK toxin-antitoxin module